MAPSDPDDGTAPLLRRLLQVTVLAASIQWVLILWTCWGRWSAFAIVLALQVGRFALNAVAQKYIPVGGRQPYYVMTAFNVAVSLAIAHFSDWSWPNWFHLAISSLFHEVFSNEHRRRPMLVVLAFTVALALVDGAPLLAVVAFASFTVLVHEGSAVRAAMMAQAHRVALERHRELAAIREQAMEQERLASLGTLAAGIAHEINNPVAFVKANVGFLRQELERTPALTPGLRECLDEVLPETLHGLERIRVIVADISHLARKGPAVPVPFDLNAEAQSAVRLASQALKTCNVEVFLSDLPPAVGNPGEVSQVLVNLLVNAADATDRRGHVSVHTSRRDGMLAIEIVDDGCGIPADLRQKIFEPFFTTKPVGKGIGLGLAVTRSIVEGHGGRIEIESTPGEGSRFRVLLPAEADGSGGAVATRRDAGGQRPTTVPNAVAAFPMHTVVARA